MSRPIGSVVSRAAESSNIRKSFSYLHVTHVLHDILEVLVSSETRKLVGYHLLPVASEHPGGITHVETLTWLV